MPDVRTVPLSVTQRERLADLQQQAALSAARFEEACNVLALAVVSSEEGPRTSVALTRDALVVTVTD